MFASFLSIVFSAAAFFTSLKIYARLLEMRSPLPAKPQDRETFGNKFFAQDVNPSQRATYFVGQHDPRGIEPFPFQPSDGADERSVKE